jgi:hypothetical protein
VHDRLSQDLCSRRGAVEALSSLAAGADQLFAEIALACGAELVVVTPSRDFEAGFADPAELAGYRGLKKQAREEILLDYPCASELAYLAAGKYIVDRSDLLLAVWDGKPARGLGGTADVVAYARESGKRVSVIWKPGDERP